MKSLTSSRDSSGHTVEFSELFRSHWTQVLRICLRITRNQHDAEDAAQDCFMRAFSHLHQFQGNAQITTWLYTIARNSSLMLLRKRASKQEEPIERWPDSYGDLPPFSPTDGCLDPLRCVLHAETCGLLLQSVATLPTKLRAVAKLFFLEERTLQEVGQALNISSAGAKSRLFRVRRRLSRFEKSRSHSPRRSRVRPVPNDASGTVESLSTPRSENQGSSVQSAARMR